MKTETYCRKTVRGRIRDFFADHSVNQFDTWKWGGLILLASLLGLLALAGCAGQAPTLEGPRYSRAGAVTLNGTGTPGTLVEILDENGNQIDTTTVGATGAWSVPSNFEVGDHNLKVRQISRPRLGRTADNPLVLAEGNQGRGILTTYDLPSVTGPSGNLNPGLIALAGAGTAGSLIELFANGESLGITEVGADGRWSLDADLPDAGSYDISAKLLDPDGNILGQVDGPSLGLAAGFVPLAANGRIQPGTFSTSDNTTASGPISWSGTGMPGRTVELIANGQKIGETVIGADGTWSISDVNADLNIATNLVTARMLDDNGDVLGSPITDTIRLSADNVDGYVVAPPPEPPTEDGIAVTIDSVDTNEAGITTLVGTAPAGETVQIWVNEEFVGTVVADDAGNWSLSGYFPVGEHIAQAAIGDGDDFAAVSDVVDIIVDANALTGDGTPPAGKAWVRVVSQSEIDARNDGTFDDRFLSGSAAIAMILDASWSMTLPIDSNAEADRLTRQDPNNRINIAKSEMINLINDTIPQGTPVALRSLGNRGGNLGCVTALEYPLQGMNRADITAAINDVSPGFNTNTPLAATLAQIPSDLADAGDRERVVILLTDGEEKCGGDVDAAIDSLIQEGISLRLNIIGFAVNDAAVREKLEGWATRGNGFYFDASDASGLGDALQNSLASVYQLLNNDNETVATGVVGSDPIEVDPGIYTIRITSAEGFSTNKIVVPTNSAVQVTVK